MYACVRACLGGLVIVGMVEARVVGCMTVHC